MDIAGDLTVGLCAAGLGYDLDDAAAGMAILRFKPAGLDLHFLDEGLVDAAAEGAVGTRPDAQAPEGWIVDRNAVRDIGILESTGAGDGGVIAAGLNTVDRAGAQVEEVGDTPLHRNIFKKSIRDIRSNSRGGRIYGYRGGTDLHDLGNLARFQDDFDAGGLIDLDFGAFDAGELEAWLLHLDGIDTGDQRGEEEGALFGR